MTPAAWLSTLILFRDGSVSSASSTVREGATFSPRPPSSRRQHGRPRARSAHSGRRSGARDRRIHGTAGPGDPADPRGGKRPPRRAHGHREDGGGPSADPPEHPPREADSDELPLHHAVAGAQPGHAAADDVLRGATRRARRGPPR